MIVVTGAAGFIGSCLIQKLNEEGFNYIVAVDDFSFLDKNKNLEGKNIKEKVEREVFFEWLKNPDHHRVIEFVFHIGARTDTTEFDKSIFDKLNEKYSQDMWNACCEYQIPLVYASSAATYGLGEYGYDDNENDISKLKPLNPY